MARLVKDTPHSPILAHPQPVKASHPRPKGFESWPKSAQKGLDRRCQKVFEQVRGGCNVV